MMFPNRKVLPKKEPKDKCKIIVKKVGNRVEKSIEGNCSRSQLEALSGQKVEEE